MSQQPRPFNNTSSQAERRAVIKGDREPTTYHQLANVDAALEGGRFSQDRVVSGAEPSVNYPAVSSPWSSAQPQPGAEPALGFSVDQMEPVGIPAEIDASIARLSFPEGSAPAPSRSDADVPAAETTSGRTDTSALKITPEQSYVDWRTKTKSPKRC
jgi:hypothetical protein